MEKNTFIIILLILFLYFQSLYKIDQQNDNCFLNVKYFVKDKKYKF